MIEVRRAPELRAEPGRRLTGRVVRYGDTATVYIDGEQVREQFGASAFRGWLRSGSATRLNVMHFPELTVASTVDGSLVLQDTPTELRMVAKLGEGAPYDRVLRMVGTGMTSGLSVEFRAVQEHREGNKRIITEAALPGLGVVDSPAYGESLVETRRRGRVIRSTIPRGKKLRCECVPPACNVQFDDFALRDEVIAVSSTYNTPIASLRRGSLRIVKVDGDLHVEVDLPDIEAAQGVLDADKVAGIYMRPFIDQTASDYVEEGDTRTYSRAVVRAIIVGSTDAVDGWDPAEIITPRRAEQRGIAWPLL